MIRLIAKRVGELAGALFEGALDIDQQRRQQRQLVNDALTIRSSAEVIEQ